MGRELYERAIHIGQSIINEEIQSFQELLKFIVAPVTVAFYLAAASTKDTPRCLDSPSSATYLERVVNESSTLIRNRSEVKAQLDAMLSAARESVIEDGMRNPVTERLPGLILNYAGSVLPALPSILTVYASPMVAAEVPRN